MVRRVRRNSWTYLEASALRDLRDLVLKIEAQQLEGILVETGCALGGSAIVMASVKRPTRPLEIYDVFGTIPPPSERDGDDVHERYQVIREGRSEGIGGQQYYGYQENLRQRVAEHFAEAGFPIEQHSVSLVKGLFEDTLHFTESIALAHIDCDWYESVMTSLQRIVPHLAVGGVLVIDDYYAWSGCQKAVDDFFADKRADFSFMRHSRLHIVRN